MFPESVKFVRTMTAMHTSSLSELKKELQLMPQEELLAVCLRLAKYKKDNKQLLHYLLFESRDEDAYIENVKAYADMLMEEINTTNFYLAKKTIRKVLRITNQYIRYSGKDTTAIELLMHFCRQMQRVLPDFRKSTALANLYEAQIKKIRKAINTLHEDLQYDYEKEMTSLTHESR